MCKELAILFCIGGVAGLLAMASLLSSCRTVVAVVLVRVAWWIGKKI